MNHRVARCITVCGIASFLACAGERNCADDWCGTLVIVTGGEPASLFPATTNTTVEAAARDFVFLPLAEIGPGLGTLGDSGFAPRLARGWAFEDSLTIRFELDSAARWHDGAPVTADDVAFTFDVYRDTLVAAAARQRLEAIASVTVRSQRTAVFGFRRAYPEQFYDAVYHMRILPRHLLDTIPRERLSQHPLWREPVGNGPYRFVRWLSGEFLEFAADSAFFLGKPGVPRILWRFTAELNTAIPQLLAGEADFLNTVGGSENLERLGAAPHLRLVKYPSATYTYIAFNLYDPAAPARPHPLFADRELRRALAMGVDASATVAALFGDLGIVPTGPMTPLLWVWSEDVAALRVDTAAARGSLDALGWRDGDGDGVRDRGGKPLRFEVLVPSSSSSRQRAAIIVQDQLRRIGVAMEISPLEINALVERVENRRFDAVFGGYTLDPSPVSIEEVWGRNSFDAMNWGRYANPEVERLFARAKSTTDPAVAREAWREAVGLINADAPAIWAYSPEEAAAVHRRFENVSIRPDQFGATIWRWRVTPGEWIERDLVK